LAALGVLQASTDRGSRAGVGLIPGAETKPATA